MGEINRSVIDITTSTVIETVAVGTDLGDLKVSLDGLRITG